MDPNGTPPASAPRPRLLFLLPLVVLALAAVVAVLLLRGGQPSFHGTAWDPPQRAADFRLVDHRGEPHTLSQHRGSTVLLFFGFTNCPDVCPLTLTRLSLALRELDADTSQVRILLVTVDPQRDSPEALARYVGSFGPHVVGLTGGEEALEQVRRDYHAWASVQEPAGDAAPTGPAAATPPPVGHDTHDGHGAYGIAAPTIAHTTQVFGIDRRGRLRVLISPEFQQETIMEDIRTLMRL